MDWHKQAHDILFGAVGPGFFAVNREKIAQANRRVLQVACIVAALLMGVLFGASLLIEEMRAGEGIYFALCLISLGGALLAACVLPQRPGAARGILYGFIVLWNAAALVLGTVYSRDAAATVYFLVVLLTSTLVLDKPYRSLEVLLFSNLAFGIVSACIKTQPFAVESDLINAAFTFLLGAAYCVWLTNIRLQNLSVVQELLAHNEQDPLTGLANKAAIDQRCRTYLQPGRAAACAMILLDIDDFREINETLGRAAGDEALHNVALTLRTMFRENDIVGRFGGDEFIVLMKNVSNPQDVQEKARRLSTRLSDIVVSGRPLQCSMGIALSDAGDSITFEDLFAHADMALYSSKSNGKNTITIFRAEQVAAAAVIEG